MIKTVALAMALYTLLAAAGGYALAGAPMALSILAGGLMMLLNLGGLAFFWKLIFSKKSIALAVLVIIFKYVILGLILWSLGSVPWLKAVGFLIGLASLIFAVLVAAIKGKTQSVE